MVSETSNQQQKIKELSAEIEHLRAALRQREDELDDNKKLLSKREEESVFSPARTEHMARRHSTAIQATLLGHVDKGQPQRN